MQKMARGGESAYEELFQYACPKFITPAPPSLDAPSMNTNQVLMRKDCIAAALSAMIEHFTQADIPDASKKGFQNQTALKNSNK